jgi:hypothetical protein
MPKARSVSNIKSNLLRPALTSHFAVQIPIPNEVKSVFSKSNTLKMSLVDQDKLNLLCSEVSLPGSSLATLEINNDFTGVTERHAHRRIYDDRIDFTFYVDAEKYLPILFFEGWIKYICGESVAYDTRMRGNVGSRDEKYFYRVRYPNTYVAQGLKVTKFEKDIDIGGNSITYEFIKSYPISIQSMPVSYDASSLLKCTVSMTYIRYVITPENNSEVSLVPEYVSDPQQQAIANGYNFQNNPTFQNPQFNVGGVPDFAANSSGNTVDRRVEAGLPGVGRVTFAERSIFGP